jgi:hypothetical protein
MFLAPMTIVPKRTHGDGGDILFVNQSQRCTTVGQRTTSPPADLRSPPKRIRREAARPKKCPLPPQSFRLRVQDLHGPGQLHRSPRRDGFSEGSRFCARMVWALTVKMFTCVPHCAGMVSEKVQQEFVHFLGPFLLNPTASARNDTLPPKPGGSY